MSFDERRFELELRPIQPGDKLTGFSIGERKHLPLKVFLQRHARPYHDNNLARTYGMFSPGDPGKLVAYVTLVCGEVATEGEGSLLDPTFEFRYSSYPAIKIARLAVDSKYRGRDIGSRLVEFSLGMARDVICPAVGCRFVVVDAKEDAVDFYLKQGFTMLDTKENKMRDDPIMFIDLHKATMSSEA